MAIERIREGGLSLSRRALEFPLRIAGITHQKGLIDDPRLIRPRINLIDRAQKQIDLNVAYLDLLDKSTLEALKSAGVPVSVYPSSRVPIMLVDHQHVASLIPVPGDGKIKKVEQYIVRNYKSANRKLLEITRVQRIFDSINSLPTPSSLQP